MEEISVTSSDLPWEDVADYPGGMQRKVLRRGSDDKPRVALLRLQPGFESDAHSHGLAENHWVLEGMYESHGREYPVGSYRFIPKHTSHGPTHSHGGALLLVLWES